MRRLAATAFAVAALLAGIAAPALHADARGPLVVVADPPGGLPLPGGTAKCC